MSLSTQFLTMISMIGMGAYFGAALDTYNRFLKRRKRKNWIVFINDILFLILQGVIIFYVLYLVNKGELRFYIFLALLCGFSFYQGVAKNSYLSILEFVIRTIKWIYHFIVRLVDIFIIKPCKWFVMLIFTSFIMILKGLLTLIKVILNVILFLIKGLLVPFKWVGIIIWKLSPKSIKISIYKIYNKIAGLFTRTKKFIVNMIRKWKK